ncbi:hypothetical protein QUF61_13840 [Candidatus Venteria ishoeyi]|uniref:hypothetical protein n=1 Tax=Candidatus Venteria ishoeyi TaxID=1899563 RepID=UPI0025A59D64|nr:hypothetical protein [Candidatus Venteria ishoeyi]MDM8547568.1 hypothetical protein [Candidatus Venteria ishoeyi]
MHTTLEALYDPKTGLKFTEPVQINKPVRVLITIMDTYPDEQQDNMDSSLLSKLRKIHQIPCSDQRSSTAIDDYIQANRNQWD